MNQTVSQQRQTKKIVNQSLKRKSKLKKKLFLKTAEGLRSSQRKYY